MADLPAWADEMLRSARVGRLATADAAARPLVVPVCYAFDGESIYSAIDAKPKRTTGRALRRVRNLEENPRASLVVDEYDEEWVRLRYVIAEGPVALLTGGDRFGRAVDLLREKYPQYRAMGLDRAAGLVLAVAPLRFRAWRFADMIAR
jgi:PPOX class probable F420-dependent enzyme